MVFLSPPSQLLILGLQVPDAVSEGADPGGKALVAAAEAGAEAAVFTSTLRGREGFQSVLRFRCDR